MPTETPATLPQGEFVGREHFRQHLRQGLQLAASQGWPELWLFDTDFRDWPLNEPAVQQALHTWVQHGRQLTLLALRYDEVPRQHPLFVRWRQQWAHKIEARVCREADADTFCSAFYTPAWGLLCHDHLRYGGHCGSAPAFVAGLRERMQHLHAHSRPGFAAYTLGL